MNQRLKATPGIFLVGFMGCGKSTVGRLAAERLGWEFVDLDDEVEKAAGRPIPAIFESAGEAAFRELEREVLLEQIALVRRGLARVVALGGGAFASERNREALDVAGMSVWLDASAERLWERVRKEGHRPLARDREAFVRLLGGRRSSYQMAHYRLDSDRVPEAVAGDIVDLV